MLPGEVSMEVLQTKIDQLKRMIEVSGIPATSLMGGMLASSLDQLDRAVELGDWATVERGLQSTKALLLQCTI